MKKILFVNPAVNECGVPNLGLAMLSAMLKQRGHDVRIADYHFSFKTPNIQDILNDFKPDVIGISMHSAVKDKINEMIEVVSNANIPVLCGGPHTISYYSELLTDNRLDYIFLGETEDVISQVVENAKVNEKPELIQCPVPDINTLPFPDYLSFYCCDSIKVYPFITSRGCPYNCSFCSVPLSNSRKWRLREVELSIRELSLVHKNYPSVEKLVIWDDNFSLNIREAKLFLKKYIENKFNFKFEVANVRADSLDKDFLMLLKKAGCEKIQFGVEHGNSEVFRHIGKGETLEDIKQAAKLVHKYRMKLICSFIIGLPYDTLEKTRDSINFAKELKPYHIYWNILVPYKGTRVYEYFKKYGQVDDNSIPFTIPQNVLSFEPNADTPYFTREERKKAYLMACLLSKDTSLLHMLKKTIFQSLKYNLIKELLYWYFNPIILRSIISAMRRHILNILEKIRQFKKF